MTTFEEQIFLRAYTRYCKAEMEKARDLLELEKKVTTDLLFKCNKLTTENDELKRRLHDPLERFERELFPEINEVNSEKSVYIIHGEKLEKELADTDMAYMDGTNTCGKCGSRIPYDWDYCGKCLKKVQK